MNRRMSVSLLVLLGTLLVLPVSLSAVDMVVNEVNPTDILASTVLFGGDEAGSAQNADVTSDISYVFSFGRLYFFRQNDLSPLWKTPFSYEAEFPGIRTDLDAAVAAARTIQDYVVVLKTNDGTPVVIVMLPGRNEVRAFHGVLGNELWAVPLEGLRITTPLAPLERGRKAVVFGRSDRRLMVLDIETGNASVSDYRIGGTPSSVQCTDVIALSSSSGNIALFESLSLNHIGTISGADTAQPPLIVGDAIVTVSIQNDRSGAGAGISVYSIVPMRRGTGDAEELELDRPRVEGVPLQGAFEFQPFKFAVPTRLANGQVVISHYGLPNIGYGRQQQVRLEAVVTVDAVPAGERVHIAPVDNPNAQDWSDYLIVTDRTIWEVDAPVGSFQVEEFTITDTRPGRIAQAVVLEDVRVRSVAQLDALFAPGIQLTPAHESFFVPVMRSSLSAYPTMLLRHPQLIVDSRLKDEIPEPVASSLARLFRLSPVAVDESDLFTVDQDNRVVSIGVEIGRDVRMDDDVLVDGVADNVLSVTGTDERIIVVTPRALYEVELPRADAEEIGVRLPAGHQWQAIAAVNENIAAAISDERKLYVMGLRGGGRTRFANERVLPSELFPSVDTVQDVQIALTERYARVVVTGTRGIAVFSKDLDATATELALLWSTADSGGYPFPPDLESDGTRMAVALADKRTILEIDVGGQQDGNDGTVDSGWERASQSNDLISRFSAPSQIAGTPVLTNTFILVPVQEGVSVLWRSTGDEAALLETSTPAGIFRFLPELEMLVFVDEEYRVNFVTVNSASRRLLARYNLGRGALVDPWIDYSGRGRDARPYVCVQAEDGEVYLFDAEKLR